MKLRVEGSGSKVEATEVSSEIQGLQLTSSMTSVSGFRAYGASAEAATCSKQADWD